MFALMAKEPRYGQIFILKPLPMEKFFHCQNFAKNLVAFKH